MAETPSIFKLSGTENEDNMCFALAQDMQGTRNENKCKILSVTRCVGFENCAHYRTQKQVDENNRKAKERLRSLDEKTQKHIEEKYGIKIWED